MIKIFQDKFGLGGNCQSAVLASLLELPIDSVPWFSHDLGDDCTLSMENRAEIFYERIDVFLEKYGYELNWYIPTDDFNEFLKKECNGIPYQVCGKSPRGYNHVVIYLDGEMVHDPHPEGGGVIMEHIGLINKIK